MLSVITNASGSSSQTRGLFNGGQPGPVNTIQYITIASTGNATDFGDMTISATLGAAASSHITALFAGGGTSSYYNNISSVTIATTGNAIDFGDLLAGNFGLAGCSSAHGGLA